MNLKKLFFALFFLTLLISGCTEEESSTESIKTEDIQGIVTATKDTAEKHDVSKFEEFELESVIDGLSL